MAAMKVFSVPEILKDIILRAAYEAKIDEAEKCGDRTKRKLYLQPVIVRGKPYRLEPAASISRLSMVCRTFQSTIQESPKLQRAVTGSQEATLNVTDCPPSIPLRWLLEHAFGVEEQRWATIQRVQLDKNRATLRCHLQTFLKAHGLHPEASWRKVRVTQEAKGRCLRAMIAFRKPNGYRGVVFYTEDIESGHGATLGAVFEQLSTILLRSEFEDMARLRS